MTDLPTPSPAAEPVRFESGRLQVAATVSKLFGPYALILVGVGAYGLRIDTVMAGGLVAAGLALLKGQD